MSASDDEASCVACGGPLSEARIELGITTCSGPCNAARFQRGVETHGANHAPLGSGVWLDPGFCVGCDRARIGEEAGLATQRPDDREATLRGLRFRVESACDGYGSLTADEPFRDIPDEWADEADAYAAGAAVAAAGIRAALVATDEVTP